MSSPIPIRSRSFEKAELYSWNCLNTNDSRAQFRTRFTRDQGVIVGEGTVRDFSPGGCHIRSFTPPLVGSDVELCIYPDDASGGLAIQLAKVCWVRDYEFGVAFVAIDPEVAQQLALLWSALKPSESRAKAS